MEWEKIFANDATSKGLISKIYKQLRQLNIKKKLSNQKVDRRPKQTFLQRRYIDGQEAYEKVLNVDDNWRNTNQRKTNTIQISEISPVRMANIKKSTNNKCWRRCEEKELHLHCWQECKFMQPLWRRIWRFLKNLLYDPAIPLLVIYSEKMKPLILKDLYTPIFIAALSAIAKT